MRMILATLAAAAAAAGASEMHMWAPGEQAAPRDISASEAQAVLAHHLGVAHDVNLESADLLRELAQQSVSSFAPSKQRMVVVVETNDDLNAGAPFSYNLPSHVKSPSWLSLVALHSLRSDSAAHGLHTLIGKLSSALPSLPSALSDAPASSAKGPGPAESTAAHITAALDTARTSEKLSVVHVPEHVFPQVKHKVLGCAASFPGPAMLLRVPPFVEHAGHGDALSPFGATPALSKSKRQLYGEDPLDEELNDIMESVMDPAVIGTEGSGADDASPYSYSGAKSSSSAFAKPHANASLAPGQTVLVPSDGKCYASADEALKDTDSCSGHGSPVKGVSPQGKTCYVCACAPSKEGTKVTYWSGPACSKQDLSSPFFLLAGTTITLVLAAVAAVAAIFNMGSEPLPQMLSAGASSGHLKSD